MKQNDLDYKIPNLRVGQVVTGKVLKVESNTIYLDLNSFTEGRIHLDSYTTDSVNSFIGLVKVGDTVEARIQKIQNEPHSMILLSRLPILKEQAFDDVIKDFEEGKHVEVKIKKTSEKGFLADYKGYEVFIPYSLVEHEMHENAKNYVSKRIEVLLIKAERRGRFTDVVGSRKPIFQKERQEAFDQRNKDRQDELDSMKTGDIVEGTVEKIEKNAAIIRFNHIIGLLRISQVSHHRIDEVGDALAVGDKVTVKVIKKEGNRLDLSIKALEKTPYEIYSENNQVGSTVTGKVVQKLPFGLVVELAKDVKGLLHKSEFSWNPSDNFDSFVKIGDELTLRLINIDPKKERISLSKRVLEDNPWANVNVKKGQKVNGTVTEITKNGLVVEVEGVPANIPLSELSIERIGKVEDYFAVGDSLEAEVIDFEKNSWVMTLSIKRLQNKNERANFEKYLEEENDDAKVTIGDFIDESDSEK